MPLNPDLVGRSLGPVRRSWSSTDTILYALGVGAGTSDLALTTENTSGVPQRVLPTFAGTLSQVPELRHDLGDVNPAKAVHAQQSITLHRPLEPQGELDLTRTITGVHDKKSGALVLSETEARDGDGQVVFTAESGVFVRGEGGFGGDRGPTDTWEAPSREPDHRLRYETRRDQALLYRLSGDRNPLHSDPAFAQRAGFSRPILHGMCTYGITARALLGALCDGDTDRFLSMSGRFSKSCFPGDDLEVLVWQEGHAALFQTVLSDGAVVIDRGRFRSRAGDAQQHEEVVS